MGANYYVSRRKWVEAVIHADFGVGLLQLLCLSICLHCLRRLRQGELHQCDRRDSSTTDSAAVRSSGTSTALIRRKRLNG